jgi:outer membrane protein assembly factor BamB
MRFPITPLPCALQAALLALGLLAGPGLAQRPGNGEPFAKLSGESVRAATHLAEAQKKAEQGEWADAIDGYQRSVDEFGDDLVPIAEARGPRRFASVRLLVTQRLAAMPAAGLRIYRARVDEQARKWFAQGEADHDPAPLRRVLDEAFCSRWGDRAIDLLGDLAFERGQFDEAERYWLMLTGWPSEADHKPEGRMVFPDSQVDPALVRAKLVLSAIYRNDLATARAELKAFAGLYPKAAGPFAGRTGTYTATLQDLLPAPGATVEPPGDDLTWPTFAGSLTRNRVMPRPPRFRWLEESWRVRLDGQVGKPEADAPAPVPTPTRTAQLLAFYPVIVGDHVLVADNRSVMDFDLLSGRFRQRCDLQFDFKVRGDEFNDFKLPVPRPVRFTLTAAPGRVYGCLHTSPQRQRDDSKLEAEGSMYLTASDLGAGRDGALTPRWWKAASREPGDAYFEGSPVVHENSVLVVWTQMARPKAATSIRCYNADTGALRWSQPVCETDLSLTEGEPLQRHTLLTLAGPYVVYSTDAGLIVALDPNTGKRAWAHRYARRARTGEPVSRDLTPPVYAGGRVYVAPTDGDRLLCLDSTSGRLLWESKPLDVVQVLGVAHNRVIFTTGSFPRGIRALDATTGADLRDWMQPDDGSSELPTFGRGLLAGDNVYWPTLHGLRVLRQEDGQPVELDRIPAANVPGGNLALGNGCLIIATERELIGYVAPARVMEKRRKEAGPGAALPLYRLGLAQADAGLELEALKTLRQAARAADTADVREQVRRAQFAVVSQWLDRPSAQVPGDLLTTAGADQWPVAWEAEIRARLARLTETAGSPRDALAAWQTLLTEDRLRNETIRDAQGLRQPAGLLAARRQQAIIRANGAEVYSMIEAQAKQSRAAFKDDVAVERMTAIYPNSATTKTLLAKQPAEAARWSLTMNADGEERATALVRLARDYEAAHAWSAARCTWQRLASECGERSVSALAPDEPARQWVARRLLAPEYAEPPLPALTLPLGRRWEMVLDADRDPAEGYRQTLLPLEAADEGDCFFTIDGPGTVSCREVASGKTRWDDRPADRPTWLARHGNTVVIGGSLGISRVRLADGKPLWRWSEALLPTERVRSAERRFTSFHLAGCRVLALEGSRRLIALDVETGETLWERWAPGGHILAAVGGRYGPAFWASGDRVLLQTGAGWELLDAADGHVLRSGPGDPRPWRHPPLLLDDNHLCFAPAPGQLHCLAPRTGKDVWSIKLDHVTTLTGEYPQLQGRGDTLLVLVPRSAADELCRLDPATGRTLWSREPPLGRRSRSLSLVRAAVDATSVYLAADQQLMAVSLADGKTRWRQTTAKAPGPWQVVRTRDGVLAYPVSSALEWSATAIAAHQMPINVVSVFPTQAILPFPPALALLTEWAQQARSPSVLPLVIADPKDGVVQQRQQFASRGPQSGIVLTGGGAVVVMEGAAWWLSGMK